MLIKVNAKFSRTNVAQGYYFDIGFVIDNAGTQHKQLSRLNSKLNHNDDYPIKITTPSGGSAKIIGYATTDAEHNVRVSPLDSVTATGWIVKDLYFPIGLFKTFEAAGSADIQLRTFFFKTDDDRVRQVIYHDEVTLEAKLHTSTNIPAFDTAGIANGVTTTSYTNDSTSHDVAIKFKVTAITSA